MYPVTIIPDLQFVLAGGTSLRANLYIPQGTSPPPPVIVWVHGGGWRFGNRRLAPDLSRFFGQHGFAMAAIDYRLTNRATFPAQIDDLKTAIRWLRTSGPTYGLDITRIGLWGASAGGHLSALAALTTKDRFEPEDAPYLDASSGVQAVVVGYAPVDFLQLDAHRAPEGTVSDDPETLRLPRGMRSADAHSFESLLLGAPIETCPDRVREANPITYADPGAPPFLILHGLSDTTVPPHQSELLFEALAAHGNDVTLCLIEGLGHGFLNRSHLDDVPARPMSVRTRQHDREHVERHTQPIFPMIETFFRKHLMTTSAADARTIRAGSGP